MTECFKSLKVHLNIERIWLDTINVQLNTSVHLSLDQLSRESSLF